MSRVPDRPTGVGGASPLAHPDPLARHLADAVVEAGRLARSMFGAGLKTWTKGNDSPVTEADIAADRLLHARLTPVDASYGWLSEETADSPARLAARRVWVVDPIDGTRGFMEGNPDWAVSAALVEDGRPLIAALYAPVTEELFLAVRGAGATRNGAPLSVTPRETLEGAAVAGPAAAVDVLARIVPITRLPRGRSLALRIARVATGEIDIALSANTANDWDLAAADLVVAEAHGVLTTYDGALLRYNAKDPRHPPLICAGTALHARALDAARAGSPLPSF